VKLRTDNRARKETNVPKTRLVKVRSKLLAAGAKVTNEDTQKVMAEFP
jgi:hypothetical protein